MDKELQHIVLDEQQDGNWIGKMTKFGKEIEVREVKPEDCLIKLITHDGK